MNRHLILGPPGTGKTERLMSILEREMGDGVPPERVAFVSFTRAAVGEALDRFSKKFEFPKTRAPFFRTIHSLCFRQLGLRRDQVMERSRVRDFGRRIGVRLTGFVGDESPSIEGDRMLFLCGLVGATCRPLEDLWDDLGGVDRTSLLWFAGELSDYKEKNGLVDFSDMLTLYAEEGEPVDVDAVLIDEAQDLTEAQWRVIERAFGLAPRTYVAGDDDQSIHCWAGSSVERFRTYPADSSEVLPTSYRVPRRIHDLAQGIADRIGDRYEKEWGPSDREGDVRFVGEAGHLDLSSGEWLLLARNAYLLERYEEECRYQGVPYEIRGRRSVDQADIKLITDHEKMRKGESVEPEESQAVRDVIGDGDPTLIWHEAFRNMGIGKRSYYLTMLRRGERLRGRPRVRIDTIHGVKGLEADNVALLTDVSRASHEESVRSPDGENRVLYVGVTRAREVLYIVAPQTGLHFDV